MFPYDDYLKVAKDLATRKGEAYLRSSVSRAYYACFHLVREYAMKDGVLLRGTKDEHSQVVAYLHNHSDPNLQVAGDYQSRLRKARKWCDYDAVVKHISQVSSQSLMNAENIFSALNKKQATSV